MIIREGLITFMCECNTFFYDGGLCYLCILLCVYFMEGENDGLVSLYHTLAIYLFIHIFSYYYY